MYGSGAASPGGGANGGLWWSDSGPPSDARLPAERPLHLRVWVALGAVALLAAGVPHLLPPGPLRRLYAGQPSRGTVGLPVHLAGRARRAGGQPRKAQRWEDPRDWGGPPERTRAAGSATPGQWVGLGPPARGSGGAPGGPRQAEWGDPQSDWRGGPGAGVGVRPPPPVNPWKAVADGAGGDTDNVEDGPDLLGWRWTQFVGARGQQTADPLNSADWNA
eukprot:EG_transcript_29003